MQGNDRHGMFGRSSIDRLHVAVPHPSGHDVVMYVANSAAQIKASIRIVTVVMTVIFYSEKNNAPSSHGIGLTRT